MNASMQIHKLGFQVLPILAPRGSYGFRPGRGQHDALDALAVGITYTKVSWIVDADVRSFFDSMSHEWLIRFVEHRVGDPPLIRLIRKWLKAARMDGAESPSSAHV